MTEAAAAPIKTTVTKEFRKVMVNKILARSIPVIPMYDMDLLVKSCRMLDKEKIIIGNQQNPEMCAVIDNGRYFEVIKVCSTNKVYWTFWEKHVGFVYGLPNVKRTWRGKISTDELVDEPAS
jgi:hypothetical protein